MQSIFSALFCCCILLFRYEPLQILVVTFIFVSLYYTSLVLLLIQSNIMLALNNFFFTLPLFKYAKFFLLDFYLYFCKDIFSYFYFFHCSPHSIYFLNFLFCIGVQPVNNAVIISGEQQKGLSHTYTCIHSPPNFAPTQAVT